MSRFNQLICGSFTALITAAFSCGPVAAQDIFTFMRPPALSQPVYDIRNYTTLGEKIVTVVAFLVLALVLIGLFHIYPIIKAAFS
jgi:hypothetical protein